MSVGGKRYFSLYPRECFRVFQIECRHYKKKTVIFCHTSGLVLVLREKKLSISRFLILSNWVFSFKAVDKREFSSKTKPFWSKSDFETKSLGGLEKKKKQFHKKSRKPTPRQYMIVFSAKRFSRKCTPKNSDVLIIILIIFDTRRCGTTWRRRGTGAG